MKVSKWGNSLAIRLPADVVAKMGLKEGDEFYSIPGMSEEGVTLKRKKSPEEWHKRLQEIRKLVKIPASYKFDREEMYDEHMNNRWKKDE